MKVLGVNSSPRAKGNSRYLMDMFMAEMESRGHTTQLLDATKLKITPCIGCGACERTGHCVFKDDEFTTIFLPAVIEADIMVISSPVYFYAFPAEVKALIDRIQVLWSRKYRLKTKEFEGRDRKGVLLAVAATKGKDLFTGMEVTARYFFDAAGMSYAGSLLYRGMDEKGELEQHSGVKSDIEQLVDNVCGQS